MGSFWIACSLDEGSDEKRTDKVIGTYGYMPPEYYRGVITTKMDAFAFGVVRNRIVLLPEPPYSPLGIIWECDYELIVVGNDLRWLTTTPLSF